MCPHQTEILDPPPPLQIPGSAAGTNQSQGFQMLKNLPPIYRSHGTPHAQWLKIVMGGDESTDQHTAVGY